MVWIELDPRALDLARKLCLGLWAWLADEFYTTLCSLSPPHWVLLLCPADATVTANSIKCWTQVKMQDTSNFSPDTCLSYALKEGNQIILTWCAVDKSLVTFIHRRILFQAFTNDQVVCCRVFLGTDIQVSGLSLSSSSSHPLVCRVDVGSVIGQHLYTFLLPHQFAVEVPVVF